MNRMDAIAWTMSICIGILRLSQAKTLSLLVAACLYTPRLTLAGIGRQLAGQREGLAKQAIKQVWRFTCNTRVEPADVMPQIMTGLLAKHLKWHAKHPDKPLLISFDWTKIRSFHVLMAAVVVEGRALPFCWACYKTRVEGKSQNALEEAMLLRIRAVLDTRIKVLILADRGFGRASLIQTCQRLKLDYLIRINQDVIVKTQRWQGNLKHYPIARGQCHGFENVSYRHDGAVVTNLIVRWKKGLNGEKDIPWYLATSLTLGNKAHNTRISDMYALRFDIEELFRDTKNQHLGWSLDRTQITRPDRVSRLLLIAALAYVLLVAMGLWCRQHKDPRLWCTNKRKRELSAFSIARAMIQRIAVTIDEILTELFKALNRTIQNWG